jgi:metal-dependent amidase/aminoacylase/carboxypeptidase family protein
MIKNKVKLIEAGAFKNIDAAVMAHPGNNSLAHYTSLAIAELNVTFHGKSAHAAASPWDGINALVKIEIFIIKFKYFFLYFSAL